LDQQDIHIITATDITMLYLQVFCLTATPGADIQCLCMAEHLFLKKAKNIPVERKNFKNI